MSDHDPVRQHATESHTAVLPFLVPGSALERKLAARRAAGARLPRLTLTEAERHALHTRLDGVLTLRRYRAGAEDARSLGLHVGRGPFAAGKAFVDEARAIRTVLYGDPDAGSASLSRLFRPRIAITDRDIADGLRHLVADDAPLAALHALREVLRRLHNNTAQRDALGYTAADLDQMYDDADAEAGQINGERIEARRVSDPAERARLLRATDARIGQMRRRADDLARRADTHTIAFADVSGVPSVRPAAHDHDEQTSTTKER